MSLPTLLDTNRPPPPADLRSRLDSPHPSLQPYIRPQLGRSLFQLLSTACLYTLLWGLMVQSLSWSYWITLALAIPAAGLVVRLFIFQHDCGHGSFLPRQGISNMIGSLIGVISLTPYDYWRRTHAIHHATSGNLDRRDFGDVTTLTVKEYLSLPRTRQWTYRLYRHPIVLFLIGPAYVFVLKHRFPLDIPLSWKREWRSVMLTNLALVALIAFASWLVGWKAVLMVQLPITLLAGAFGVWLFYIQHQFDGTYWEREPTWDYHDASLQGSSYYDLPRILNWFTGNIGVHHIHHLCSRIPNYMLHQCLRENAYLQNATRLTLMDSIRCVNLKLWDEETRQLVGFRHLRKVRHAKHMLG